MNRLFFSSSPVFGGLIVLAACRTVAACSSADSSSSSDGGLNDGASTLSDGGTQFADGATGNACGQTSGTSGFALCAACTNTFCCTEILACAGNPDCQNLSTCSQRCTSNDVLCNMACRNLYPNGTVMYDNEVNCASMCGQACSTPPSGCSNVPLGTTGNCIQTQFPRVWDCPSGAPERQCVASPDGTPNRYCCLQ